MGETGASVGGRARGAILVATLLTCVSCVDPLPYRPVVVSGHNDLVLEGESALPLILGKNTVRICVAGPASDLRAGWQLRMATDGVLGPWISPGRRLLDAGDRHATICFDHDFADTDIEKRLELCGQLRREPGAEVRPLDCVRVVHRPVDAARDAIRAEVRASEDGQARMQAAERVEQLGYPMEALRMRFAGLYYLRQDLEPEASAVVSNAVIDAAEALLEGHERVATYWLGLVANARADFASEQQQLLQAWRYLGDASRFFAAGISQSWPLITFKRGEILERLGAYEEARRLGAEALAVCATYGFCRGSHIASLKFQTAWFDTIDADASEDELRRALATFEQSLNALDPRRTLDVAERYVNIALANQRLGDDPIPALREARARLDDGGEGSIQQLMLDWTELIEAQTASPAEVASRSRRLAERTANSQLAFFAYDRAGWAEYRTGNPEEASQLFDRALEHLRFSSRMRMFREVPLSTGDGTATVFRATAVALERDDPAKAWQLLDQLDEESSFEIRRRRCRAAAVGEDAEKWRQYDAEIRQGNEQLRSLDRPGPGALEARRREARADLRRRLTELQRRMPGCEVDGYPSTEWLGTSRGRDLRAFALDDEIVVLRDDGQRIVADRTPLARREVRRIVSLIEGHLERRDLDDVEWRALVAPIAKALVPAIRDADSSVVTVALHGVLQGVPLAALPLDGGGWLGSEVTTIIVPASVETPARSRALSAASDRRPLIVVNPTEELQIRTPYDELVEGARILRGAEATFDAVSRSVNDSDWLHIDTHGYYDPAFADLSYLELAGARLGLGDVRVWDARLRFANLSGCETGRWPISPDSGRYGIGGVFAAGQVERVIASRSAINNKVADLFNGRFYASLEHGVDKAYQMALDSVRDDGRPAVEWAALMLIAGNGLGPEASRDHGAEPP